MVFVQNNCQSKTFALNFYQVVTLADGIGSHLSLVMQVNVLHVAHVIQLCLRVLVYPSNLVTLND